TGDRCQKIPIRHGTATLLAGGKATHSSSKQSESTKEPGSTISATFTATRCISPNAGTASTRTTWKSPWCWMIRSSTSSPGSVTKKCGDGSQNANSGKNSARPWMNNYSIKERETQPAG